MNTYNFKIDFLSPVHIGDGEELEPYDYVVKNNIFYRINLEKFLSEFDNYLKDEFYIILNSNDFIKLREFIYKNCDIEKYSVYGAKTSKRFKNEYEKNLNNIKNSLRVSSFMKNNEYKPIIPGSSIKGAIRTAILGQILKLKGSNYRINKIKEMQNNFSYIKSNNRRFDVYANYIESSLLNHDPIDIKSDPFRVLRVSDTVVEDKSELFVGQVFNRRLKNKVFSDKKETYNVFIEVTPSLSANPSNYNSIVFAKEGKIIFDRDLFNACKQKRIFKTDFILDKDFIISSCNDFYNEVFLFEKEKFYNIGEKIKYNVIQGAFSNLKDNEFIIRIGKFSQFESLTLKGFEELVNIKHGNSRNFFENLYPLGWVKVTLN